MIIDTTYDFTNDIPNYWDKFWERSKWGQGKGDPDNKSKTARNYHRFIWSKALPCGETMQLDENLSWNGFNLSSDSISVSHRYPWMEKVLTEFQQNEPNFHAYIENFIHKSYTIGGMMVWPVHRHGSINQVKGCNRKISDRIDRTLECIRRFYVGESSPMAACFEKDRAFFELFVDFKGFVDYFFYQDLVSEDYSCVQMIMGTNDLSTPALAQDAEEYRLWLERQLNFVDKRNDRISRYYNI